MCNFVHCFVGNYQGRNNYPSNDNRRGNDEYYNRGPTERPNRDFRRDDRERGAFMSRERDIPPRGDRDSFRYEGNRGGYEYRVGIPFNLFLIFIFFAFACSHCCVICRTGMIATEIIKVATNQET